MLRPTLIIGLGSSGLAAVSEVQKMMYETFGVNRLPIIRYIYLETDSSKTHERTPAGSDITPIHITVQSLEKAYNNLSNNPQLSLDWISRELPQTLTYNAQGAGGVRPAGRLLLWGDQENRNFQKLYGAIDDAYRDIVNPASLARLESEFPDVIAKSGRPHTQAVVYVVGTLVGGTCSGTFIDIGYMIRNITGLGDSGALYGVFLVPASGQQLHAGYGNTYGALYEMDHFRTPGNYYQEVWPNNMRIPPQRLPPYAISYLISTEYGRAQYGNMSLDGCIKVAALKLFCDLVGLSSLRGAVLTDGMNEGFGAYATFGVSAIMYPKYALMEAMACEQGTVLCDRWLRGQSYQTATGEIISINQKAIFDEADSFVAGELRRAFDALSSQGSGSSLAFAIEEDVDRIVRGEEGRPGQYLSDKFVAGRSGNYSAAISDNLNAAQDQMVQAIQTYVYEKIRQTENIDYVEKLLTEIGRSLQSTQEYWDRGGIPKTVNEWNDYVTRATRRVFLNSLWWAGQKRNVLEDRINNLLNRAKMFAMRRILSLIQASLTKGSLATSDQKTSLPTVEQLGEARKHMQDARAELQRRGEAIRSEVADTSVPIHRVWHSGSFKTDCDHLKQSYTSRYGTPSLSDVLRVPALDVLPRIQGHQLFSDIKVGYQLRFRDFLPTVNVIGEAAQRINLTREYAERALTGLLRLDPPAQAGQPGVPRFVLGSDVAPVQDLVDRLRQEGLQELQRSHVRAVPLLDHAVIFYEEKCRINPQTMLVVKDSLSYWFEHPSVDPSGVRTVDPAVWKQQRLAYNVERRTLVAQCHSLVEFLLDFDCVWEKRPMSVTNVWVNTSLRWKDIPITTGNVPKYRFQGPNQPAREYELDTDPQKIRELAKSDAARTSLWDATVAHLKGVTMDSLLQSFEDDVRPYLLMRFGESETNRKLDFYFGSGDRIGFLRVLADPSVTAASMAAV